MNQGIKSSFCGNTGGHSGRQLGINKGNIAEAAKAGADIIVTGSAVFDGKVPADNAKFMLDAVKTAAKR